MSEGLLIPVCVLTVAGGVLAAGPGTGLTVKDLERVESQRGDAGGLSTSLARGPANNTTPNDFGGVYRIPEDADSPYAGWYARFSGGLIAVFPRGDYAATRGGTVPVISANTRFFLGSIPLNDRAAAKRRERAVEAEQNRVDRNIRTAPPEERPKLTPDAPPPVTVESAKDLAAVKTAMDKLCTDPVYRAQRVAELLERAGR